MMVACGTDNGTTPTPRLRGEHAQGRRRWRDGTARPTATAPRRMPAADADCSKNPVLHDNTTDFRCPFIDAGGADAGSNCTNAEICCETSDKVGTNFQPSYCATGGTKGDGDATCQAAAAANNSTLRRRRRLGVRGQERLRRRPGLLHDRRPGPGRDGQDPRHRQHARDRQEPPARVRRPARLQRGRLALPRRHHVPDRREQALQPERHELRAPAPRARRSSTSSRRTTAPVSETTRSECESATLETGPRSSAFCSSRYERRARGPSARCSRRCPSTRAR